MLALDAQDRRLLKILQVNNRTSLDHLVEEVGLSLASVQRRLKRMRDHRVISAEVAVVSPKAVGQMMTFIISVELERESIKHLNSFKKKVSEEARIQQCYYVTGGSDFIMVVTAKDMEDFETFSQQMFFDDSNIRRYKTSVVMDNTKVSLALPLGED